MEIVPSEAERQRARWRPQAVLDGGGEEEPLLVASVESYLADLAPGQVIEVISRHPAAQAAIRFWSAYMGHALLGFCLDGTTSCFWIEKGETIGAGSM